MIKKFLIGFTVLISTFLFTNSVSALETTIGTVPDIPEGFDNFIVVKRPNNTGYRLYAWKSTATVYVYNHMNNSFYFSTSSSNPNSLNTTDVSVYNSNSNGWEYLQKTGSYTWTFISDSNIMATTVNIISQDGGTPYEAGYGLISESNYEFNEDIDVSDISKIKVNFQLPEDTSNLQLKLDFSVNGLTENVGIIGFPYILLTSLNDNNNSMTNVVDFDYNLNNKNALIAQMCAIVNCYDLFEPNEYTAQFNKMIGNLEKINSNSSNKSTLILNELNTWYTEEYVNLLYDHALNLVDKTYMNNNNYSDSFNVNLLPDSTVYDYSLEINTIDYTGTLNLSFVSNLNYSISYEYESEVEDYYLTLDLNNYAAAVLIPKVINTNSSESNSFLSDIYLSGIYDIELWEDIDSKNVLFRHSNYSSNAFSHYFDYRYPNSVLYFIKKENFNGNSSIKIDTRYYSYLLLSTLSSGGSIVNPNTNQEITIPNISDLYDYDFGGDDITSIKDNIMYFFKNIESLGKMILEPVQSFFDSLPPTMKIGIIVLFVIFIAVGIIKMIL